MRKLFVLLFLAVTNTSFALAPVWQGTISRAWNLGGNWSTGLVPAAADTVTLSGSPGPLIDSSVTAVATSVKVHGPFEMSGGSLTTSSSWIILGYDAGTNGILTFGGGTITTFGTMYVGFNGNGTMYMNGGTINVNGSRFGIGYNSASSIGHAYLNAGTIYCKDFSMAKTGGTATMDITGGRVVIDGDKTGTVGPYISSGWITAYGGAGTVQMDYNITTAGKTTIMSGAAVPLATTPNPADEAVNISTSAVLSWAPGVGAVSHNVYFGTTDSPTFVANQTAAEYNPGSLAVNTIYYWRIDEVDAGNNVLTGTLWSFSTESGFKKGPYLIYPGNNSQMTVLWQTSSTAGCTLDWGTDTSYSAGSVATTEYGTDHQHKYTVTGLTPGTKYYYRITSGTAQKTGSFKTAPSSTATAVKFLAYGDTRTNPGSHNVVCGAMNSLIAADPDFQSILLHSGDWVATDSESNWDAEYFNLTGGAALQLQANVPIQGCMGNHETTGTGPAIYDKYWPYTYVDPAIGRYLSFDYGPAHIAIVDLYSSFAPESDQLTWLANDLSASTKKWKFIVLHEPGWTAGHHSNNTDVQANIQPLCEMYGVQAVLCGHNHYYARAVVNGVHHITTGAGGATFYTDITAGMPYIVTSTASVLEFCKVAISGDLMSFQAIAADGTIIDSFEVDMVKATNPNPSNSATNVAANSTLSWTAGTTAASHDVYFGTTSPGTFRGNQTATTYDPGTLTAGLTYYWRIDEKDDTQQTTTGDVWSFTTAAPVLPNPINIHLSWSQNQVGSTMLVKWATLTAANSVVRYGLTNSYGSEKTGTSLWSSACGQYIHTVELTGLTPKTTYHYSCGSTNAWSTDSTFKTGLTAGDPSEFTFALGGDTRNPDDIVPNATYAAYRIGVMNTILLQQPRFFIHLGDIPNRGRYQPQWDEIFSNLNPEFTSLPVLIAWGSHEDPDLYPNAFAQFDYPSNGTPADQDRYYSFDYGNAHFIFLFATAASATNPLTEHLIPPGSNQYNWLVNDLQQATNNPNIEWKFISVHAPPYSTATRSSGGSCVGLRQDIGPLVDQYGVNLVFTAHEHNFERTHVIKNDAKVQDVPIGSVLKSPAGAIYYVSGGAGAGLNSCDGNAWFSATYQNLRHFLMVNVNGKTLNIKAIRDNGSLLDEITVQHYKLGDFDSSGSVDMQDLSVFTGYWLETGLWP